MPAPTDFTYRLTKDNRVLISWQGKHVVTITGERAGKLIRQLDAASVEDAQLLLARITGNFKRGNER